MDPLFISKIFSDGDTIKMLSEAHKRPISVHELSIKFDIPIAGCYRRIRELEKAGLVKWVDTCISAKGKKVKLYHSDIRNGFITFFNGELKVKFFLETGYDNKLEGEFRILN